MKSALNNHRHPSLQQLIKLDKTVWMLISASHCHSYSSVGRKLFLIHAVCSMKNSEHGTLHAFKRVKLAGAFSECDAPLRVAHVRQSASHVLVMPNDTAARSVLHHFL